VRKQAYAPEVETEQEARIVSIAQQAGEISKQELARRTGLGRGALSARLRSLVERNLLEEVGVGESNGGRPPVLVRFARDAGYLVGVDLGATSLDIAVTNLDAVPLLHRSDEMDIRQGPEAVLATVKRRVREVVEEAGVDSTRVKGIGIGVPGPVEFRTGHPVSPPIMPGWHLFPVREHFEAEFGWPVFVDNDVNVMALGERWAGCGGNDENFFFVKVGTGIGCGIFCRGRIYRGADGSAGDIGHVAVGNRTTVCRCGNLGCLEAIAGGQALGRLAEEAARLGRSPGLARRLREKGSLTAADVGAVLGEGDPMVTDLVREAGATIGGVLASLVNFYNPSLIVIGGGVAKIGDLLLASVRETVYRRSLPLATRNLTIRSSALGHRAGVIGAAATVLGELYQLSRLPEEAAVRS
jgi:glucokinase-like ROK family protein